MEKGADKDILKDRDLLIVIGCLNTPELSSAPFS